MKGLIILIAAVFGLIGIALLNPSPSLGVATNYCEFRFLDPNNQNKDLTTVYPDTPFRVLIHPLRASTKYTIKGVGPDGGLIFPLQNPQPSQRLDGAIATVFPNRGDGVFNSSSMSGLAAGNYTITAYESYDSANNNIQECGARSLTVSNYPGEGKCYSDITSPTVTKNFCNSGYTAQITSTPTNSPEAPNTYECRCVLSSQIPNFKPPSNNTSGSTSHGSGFGGTNLCKDGTKGVDTALGCLPSDPGKLANVLFSIALGIAGAIAVIMIILGGFKVATSQGNVDALQDGRDTITKAITGLAFILLATTILGIIGIDILGIPFFRRDGAGIIINQK